MKLKDVLNEERIVDIDIKSMDDKFVKALQKMQAQLSKELTSKYKGKEVLIPNYDRRGDKGNYRGIVEKVIVGYFPGALDQERTIRVYFNLKGYGNIEINKKNSSIIVY